MLTLETGAGIDGADSFIDVADFDETSLNVFGSEPTGEDVAKEAALRRAFLFMKSLGWKTTYPKFDGTIPADVKTAQAIFARSELNAPESLQPSVVPGQQKVLVKAEGVAWQPTGQSGTDAQRSVVTMAMDLLKPYLNGNGSTKFIQRA